MCLAQVVEKWSGNPDSNRRPLPPESSGPIQIGGKLPVLRAFGAAATRQMRLVAGTDTGTGSGRSTLTRCSTKPLFSNAGRTFWRAIAPAEKQWARRAGESA